MNSYDGGGTPAGNWAVRELLQCYADCGYDPEIWPRTARSIASGLYTRELGLPWIATMPGHAGRQHSANEFITVRGYRAAIAFVVRLLWRLGSARVMSLRCDCLAASLPAGGGRLAPSHRSR